MRKLARSACIAGMLGTRPRTPARLSAKGNVISVPKKSRAHTICRIGTPCWPRNLATTSRKGRMAMAESIRPMPISGCEVLDVMAGL